MFDQLVRPLVLSSAVMMFALISGCAPNAAAVAAPVAEPTRELPTQTAAQRGKISLSSGAKTFDFTQRCYGPRNEASAGGGVRSRNGYPSHLWVTGCEDGDAVFHVIIPREPTPGPASPTLLDIQLPGRPRLSVAQGSIVQITNIDKRHIAGTFELDLAPADGAPKERARGTFDVTRGPDDTSEGP